MKPYRLAYKVDAQRFRQVFQKRIASIPGELDYGDVYGTVENNAFSLYVKTKPRSFSECIAEYLHIEIESDGTVKYQYKRTLMAQLIAVYAPVSALMMSILCTTVLHEPSSAYGCLALAIIFALFNCFKPKSLRQQLLDTVSRIADEARLA